MCTISCVCIPFVKYTIYMFGFESSAYVGEYYAIFDVCSSSVGVGIVKRLGDSTKTKLLWHKRIDFAYQGNDDYNRYARTMYATLLEVGMKMTSEGLRFVKEKDDRFSVKKLEVVCVLSPPWFMGVVKNVVQKKEMPFSVTENVVDAMEEKAFSSTGKTPEVLSWKDVVGDYDVLRVHKDIVLMEGYQVSSFKHRRVNELSVQFRFDLVPDNTQKHIEEVLRRIFPNHKLFFSTSLQAFSNVEVCQDSAKKGSSILLEIEGEITGIAVLKKGVVVGMSTIPLGTNHLLKTFLPKASTRKEARDSLDIFLKKNPKIEQDVLTKKTQNLLNEWVSEIHATIRGLTNGTTPSTDFVLVVDILSYPLYKFSLEKEWEMPGIRKALKLNVRHIETAVNSKKEKSNQVYDIRISTLARLLYGCTSEKGICYNRKN